MILMIHSIVRVKVGVIYGLFVPFYGVCVTVWPHDVCVLNINRVGKLQ